MAAPPYRRGAPAASPCLGGSRRGFRFSRGATPLVPRPLSFFRFSKCAVSLLLLFVSLLWPAENSPHDDASRSRAPGLRPPPPVARLAAASMAGRSESTTVDADDAQEGLEVRRASRSRRGEARGSPEDTSVEEGPTVSTAHVLRDGRNLRSLRRRVSQRSTPRESAKASHLVSSLVRHTPRGGDAAAAGAVGEGDASAAPRGASTDGGMNTATRTRLLAGGRRRGVEPLETAEKESANGRPRTPFADRNLGRAVRLKRDDGTAPREIEEYFRNAARRKVPKLFAQAVRMPGGSAFFKTASILLLTYLAWRFVVKNRLPTWVPGSGKAAKKKPDKIELASAWHGRQEGEGAGADEANAATKKDLKGASDPKEQLKTANRLKLFNARLDAVRETTSRKKTLLELQRESRMLKHEISELYPTLQRLRAANMVLERELAAGALTGPGVLTGGASGGLASSRFAGAGGAPGARMDRAELEALVASILDPTEMPVLPASAYYGTGGTRPGFPGGAPGAASTVQGGFPTGWPRSGSERVPSAP
ncbi:hypothetical protein BESB_015780 [Besnoitia besnoiti]|uniref:Uncharacterized protein n=1 Tax=Besnoitia besnoiti TaxID=94643 RepID=A0A2A9MA57_BESBE|nr:hypothetical protein BESB_015780 [Besnoitia besnoiti]PFH32260.1 hypothetical protein BESB_015780 [Besnoitia besnoiti]